MGEVGIWQVTEPESYFEQRLELEKKEKIHIAKMLGKRRIEWLAGRHLLHEMSGREIRGVCIKDEFGKPHLENSEYHISISHSHEMVSIAAAPNLIGVDIQFLVEKIPRIAYKFVRPEEEEAIDEASRIEHLHILWGAKEALYKAYGRKELSFKNHLIIEPFKYRPEGGFTTGWVIKDDYKKYFEIEYQLIGDYMLVLGVERG